MIRRGDSIQGKAVRLLGSAPMNRFCASLLVSISLNGACHHATTSNDFLPMTQGTPGATEGYSHSRPAVRFPERLELVQFEDGPNSFGILPVTDEEHSGRIAKVRFPEP